jgi:hypothetical protein
MSIKKTIVASVLVAVSGFMTPVFAFTAPPGSGGTWVTFDVCLVNVSTIVVEAQGPTGTMCPLGGEFLMSYREIKAP